MLCVGRISGFANRSVVEPGPKLACALAARLDSASRFTLQQRLRSRRDGEAHQCVRQVSLFDEPQIPG